jgi:hypothetical protein
MAETKDVFVIQKNGDKTFWNRCGPGVRESGWFAERPARCRARIGSVLVEKSLVFAVKKPKEHRRFVAHSFFLTDCSNAFPFGNALANLLGELISENSGSSCHLRFLGLERGERNPCLL